MTLRLIAFDEEETDELSFIFSDVTSGVTTYPACRFLTVSAAREDGRVDMDFNRATNPCVRIPNSRRVRCRQRATAYRCAWRPERRFRSTRTRSFDGLVHQLV